MLNRIYSIGYEGVRLPDFVATLSNAGVTIVMDVRDWPASRRPGFSKNKLSEALGEVGIQYLHRKPLGDPKPGRDAARAGDFDRFRRIFLKHIDNNAAEQAINEIIELSETENVCLLCYERNPMHCHRTLVLDRVASIAEIEVQHLGVIEDCVHGAPRERTGGGAC